MTTNQGAREALVERIAREVQEVLDETALTAPEAHGYGFYVARAVLPLVDAEVAAAVSEAQADLHREWRTECDLRQEAQRIATDATAELERMREAYMLAVAEFRDAEAEVERLRNLDGYVIGAAEKHREDTERGGCTCGFCAWSPEHVAIMAYREAVGRP